VRPCRHVAPGSVAVTTLVDDTSYVLLQNPQRATVLKESRRSWVALEVRR